MRMEEAINKEGWPRPGQLSLDEMVIENTF